MERVWTVSVSKERVCGIEETGRGDISCRHDIRKMRGGDMEDVSMCGCLEQCAGSCGRADSDDVSIRPEAVGIFTRP
ncbi:hypothetical protein TNCV_1560861 [Trichonephila clavipes]|nr:hypothetical protein TNCV_1560861 [Trichonephila clavipes]